MEKREETQEAQTYPEMNQQCPQSSPIQDHSTSSPPTQDTLLSSSLQTTDPIPPRCLPGTRDENSSREDTHTLSHPSSLSRSVHPGENSQEKSVSPEKTVITSQEKAETSSEEKIPSLSQEKTVIISQEKAVNISENIQTLSQEKIGILSPSPLIMDQQQKNTGPCRTSHQKCPEKEVCTNSSGQEAEDQTEIPASVSQTADQKKDLLSLAHQQETTPCPSSPSTSETDKKEISMSLSQEKEDSDPTPCSKEEEPQQQTLVVAEDLPHDRSQGEEPQPPLPDPSQNQPSEQQQQQQQHQGGSSPVERQKFLKEQQQLKGGKVPVKHQNVAKNEQQQQKCGKVPIKNQNVPSEKQQPKQQKPSDGVSEGQQQQQQQQQQHRKTSATSSWKSRQTTLKTSKTSTEASSGSAASKNDSAHSQTQPQQKQPPPPPPPPPPRSRSTSIPRPTRTPTTTTPTPRPSTHHHHPTHLHQNRHTFPKTTRESLPSLRPTSLGWPIAVPTPKPTRFCFSSSSSSSTRSTPPRRLYKDNNPDFFLKDPYVPPAFRNACEDLWRWSVRDKSPEVRLTGFDRFTAVFHPNWSNGTIGVRGTKPINHGVHYWEIQIPARIFGTSMMFGITTKKARLHVDSFLNLIGEDDNGWGLSHKGLAWHGGRSYPFCPAFTENVAVCVGLVYDSNEGTLTYYKNGECLGVAFRGLNSVEEDLYPAVCSTAAKTEMTLGVTRRAFVSLQDRCRAAIIRQLKRTKKILHVTKLPLPRILCHYIIDEVPLRLML